MDLHRNLDSGTEQTTQVLRDLLDNSRGITYCTRRIKSDRAMRSVVAVALESQAKPELFLKTRSCHRLPTGAGLLSMYHYPCHR